MRITGDFLNRKWKIGARQTRYRETGDFYMPLERFHGALCDRHGYVLFETEEEYMNCPQLQHGNPEAENYRLSVRPPGISKIYEYIKME